MVGVGGGVPLRLAPWLRDLLGSLPLQQRGPGLLCPGPLVVVVCFTSLGYLVKLKLATVSRAVGQLHAKLTAGTGPACYPTSML